jgi:hypothetical protein
MFVFGVAMKTSIKSWGAYCKSLRFLVALNDQQRTYARFLRGLWEQIRIQSYTCLISRYDTVCLLKIVWGRERTTYPDGPMGADPSR